MMVSRLERFALSMIIALVAATPIMAQQSSNFGTLTLASGFSRSEGRATGETGGSYSLAAIADYDQNNNPCFGFSGDPAVPDHVIDLKTSFSALDIQVKNRNDRRMTMLVKGPGMLLCGDNANGSDRASVSATNVTPGIYQVWVGNVNAGERVDYTLSVKE